MLNPIKLLKKFTNIVVRSLPWLEQWRMGTKVSDVAAFLFPHDLETLYIHKEGKHILDSYYWEENLVTVMTHEQIHATLRKNKLYKENEGFDNVFPNIPKSNFFVDGKWKWLKGKWRWDGEKWDKKNF